MQHERPGSPHAHLDTRRSPSWDMAPGRGVRGGGVLGTRGNRSPGRGLRALNPDVLRRVPLGQTSGAAVLPVPAPHGLADYRSRLERGLTLGVTQPFSTRVRCRSRSQEPAGRLWLHRAARPRSQGREVSRGYKGERRPSTWRVTGHYVPWAVGCPYCVCTFNANVHPTDAAVAPRLP